MSSNNLLNLRESNRSLKAVTKLLTANRTSSLTDVPDLRITGLTIGKSYEVFVQAYLTSSGASGVSVFVGNNGSNLFRLNLDSSASSYSSVCVGESAKFIAAATEINVNMVLGANTTVVGNSSLESTFSRCVELDYDLNEVANF